METETPLLNPDHFATGGELPPKEAHIYRSVRAELQKLPDVYDVITISQQEDGDWLYLVRTVYSSWPKFVIGQVSGAIENARPIYRCGTEFHALMEWDSLNARGAHL